jgi:Na+-translocating ferredoxin:NAD+ oxidoreductase subunit E
MGKKRSNNKENVVKNQNFLLLMEGIFKKNPVFFLILGMCPTLAVTTTVENSLGMGVATSFVLIASAVVISLFRKLIPAKVRIPVFIVIIATFVTVIQMLMEAYATNLFEKLGVYVLLIVVNCLVLGRVLAFAYKNNVVRSFFDALGMSIGFTLALLIIGFVRELIGTGEIVFGSLSVISVPYLSIAMFSFPPGALITMGLILAAINYYRGGVNE